MLHYSDVNYLKKWQLCKKLHTSSHYFLDHPRMLFEITFRSHAEKKTQNVTAVLLQKTPH